MAHVWKFGPDGDASLGEDISSDFGQHRSATRPGGRPYFEWISRAMQVACDGLGTVSTTCFLMQIRLALAPTAGSADLGPMSAMSSKFGVKSAEVGARSIGVRQICHLVGQFRVMSKKRTQTKTIESIKRRKKRNTRKKRKKKHAKRMMAKKRNAMDERKREKITRGRRGRGRNTPKNTRKRMAAKRSNAMHGRWRKKSIRGSRGRGGILLTRLLTRRV